MKENPAFEVEFFIGSMSIVGVKKLKWKRVAVLGSHFFNDKMFVVKDMQNAVSKTAKGYS